MLLRQSRLVATASLLLLSIATAASAAVLWDQSNWDPSGEGSLNVSSSSCSPFGGNTKLHTASDVSFAQGVNISTVRIYETDGNAASATQAYLWISSKTGPLPTESSTQVNNPANLVSISSAYEVVGTEAALVITASGLNIDLPPGDYWVSLTPLHSVGFFPYSVHRVTTGPIVGSHTVSISACAPNSDWLNVLDPATYDYAIKIEGTVGGPVPTLPSTWGSLKTRYR